MLSTALTVSVLLWSCALCVYLRVRLNRALAVARHDELTGLLRRTSLTAVHRRLAASSPRLALLYIDLARFKSINDRHGHAIGDDVIRATAERLKEAAPRDAHIARLGGDEFCILLADAAAIDSVQAIASDIANRIGRPVSAGGREIRMSCHVGVALSESAGEPIHDLMLRADQAMYEAKSQGVPIKCFDDALGQRLRDEQDVRSELEAALRNNEFDLAFQPKLRAHDQSMAGAEALIRWPDKLGPAGSPGVFIPIAETSGLIVDMGEWVLDRAIAAAACLETIPIAVNVSPIQLLDPAFAARVADRLIGARLDARLLEIEITETALASRPEEARCALRQLRDIGVRVFLDDFGTGYSSLSYLQDFPFDGLKIDRSFVRALSRDATRLDLLRLIIGMGHALGLEVVAEGVESERQAETLRTLGCDVLQGFELGVPGPLSALHALRRSEAA